MNISHRRIDQLPDGMDPGLASFDIMQVPTGGNLPKDDKVHMYPCYSFEFHLVLLSFRNEGRVYLCFLRAFSTDLVRFRSKLEVLGIRHVRRDSPLAYPATPA